MTFPFDNFKFRPLPGALLGCLELVGILIFVTFGEMLWGAWYDLGNFLLIDFLTRDLNREFNYQILSS
jgi:hypothetical protein